MRVLRLLAIALSFLSFSAPVLADETDTFALAIDAGRLGLMMDQSSEALKLLEPNAKAADIGPPEAQRAYVFDELVAAVLRYNLIAHEACHRSLVSENLCSGPFLPVWLKDGPGIDHDTASLNAMIDEASARLTPFWNELCDKGRKISGDEAFCAME